MKNNGIDGMSHSRSRTSDQTTQAPVKAGPYVRKNGVADGLQPARWSNRAAPLVPTGNATRQTSSVPISSNATVALRNFTASASAGTGSMPWTAPYPASMNQGMPMQPRAILPMQGFQSDVLLPSSLRPQEQRAWL